MNRMHTIREAYQWASSFLQVHGFESHQFEAELILRRALQVDRARFFAILNDPWPTEIEPKVRAWLQKRSQGEPLQYIFGDQEFYGRLFKVNPSVLIPRPETELLVETVLQEAERVWGNRALHVVDVGTGSGAIAVTLAAERPHWQITAVDISGEALNVAKENASLYGVEKQIEWMEGEYLTPLLAKKAPLDILVSNPPYIPSAVVPTLEKQVSQYEPHLALDGGADGLEPYRILTRQLAEWDQQTRLVCFEIGETQGEDVAALVQKISDRVEVEVRTDLAGRDRIVVGWIEK